MEDVQVVRFCSFNNAVYDSTGFRPINCIVEQEVFSANDIALGFPLRALSEHSHKARYPKELLIRIFSRKALLQADSWKKDAHKLQGQTYNYVIILKEVA